MRIKSLSPWIAAIIEWRILPALAWVIVPTLAVRGHFTPILPEVGHLFETPVVGDTRCWWKAVFACGVALWMVLHFVARLATGWRIRQARFGIVLALAAASLLTSVLLSPYPKTAWLGYSNFYEGGGVLLSYLIAAWYVAEMVDTVAKRLLLTRAIGIVGLLNGCHGIAEGFGWQFWQSELGLWLLGGYSRGAVQFRFSGSRMAYGTVYQPNHYGMLMAMLGALALGMALSETRRWWRVFWCVTLLSAAGGIFFSNSRAGVLTFVVLVIAFLVGKAVRVVRQGGVRQIARQWCIPSIVVLCIVMATVVGSKTVRGAIMRVTERTRMLSMPVVTQPEIEAVGLLDNRIVIRSAGQTVSLEKRLPDTWIAHVETRPGRGTPLKFSSRDAIWREAAIPNVAGAKLMTRREGNIRLSGPDTELTFYSAGARLWLITPEKMAYATVPLSTYAPTGREGFLSGRGYIWARLWEGVWKHPFFGGGPGTFALLFPNNDYLDKSRFSFTMIMDKGHGLWAMFVVTLGIVGLVAWCLPVAYGLWRIWRGKGHLRIPLLLSLSAYMICGLTNDSTIGVTPIFCALLGIGVAETVAAKGEECAVPA